MKFNKDIVIGKYLSGNLSAEEQQQLTQWLNESPNHQRELEEAEKMWGVSLNLKKESTGRADQAWQEFVALAETAPALSVVKARKSYLRPLAIAASLALIVSTVLLVKFFMADEAGSDTIVVNHQLQVLTPEPQTQAQPVDTDVAEPAAIAQKKTYKAKPRQPQLALTTVQAGDTAGIYILPDGSTVYLNKGSQLKFSDSGREVVLEGEAYFEVKPNALPFFVSCNTTVTKVLGSVNIKSAPELKAVEVMVLSGQAEVRRQGQTEILKAGERASYADGHAVVKTKVQKKDKWWKRSSLKSRIKQFFKNLKNKINQ